MPTSLQFQFRMNSAGEDSDRGTSRILLLGEFAGQSSADARTELARRPVVKVTRENLDTVLARTSPYLQLQLADGQQVELSFVSLEDFHPDSLLKRCPALAHLMGLRKRLLDPKLFDQAAQELGHVAEAAEPVTPKAAPAQGRDELLSTLLASNKPVAKATTIDDAVRRIIGQIEVVPNLEHQSRYVSAVDQAAGELLRAILHDPSFQNLEAQWRAVDMVVSQLEDDAVDVYLLDLQLAELEADLSVVSDELASTGFSRRLHALATQASDAEETWDLVVGLFDLGTLHLEMIAKVGTIASELGIPFVAGSDTSLSGEIVDASTWHPPSEEVSAAWRELRERPEAGFVALALPKLLVRLPYGRATDEIDTIAFEELSARVLVATAPPANDELLWCSGSLAVALAFASSDYEGATFDVQETPALTYTEDGERRLLAATQHLLGERVGDKLASLGFVVLLGSRHRNAVRMTGWRTISV